MVTRLDRTTAASENRGCRFFIQENPSVEKVAKAFFLARREMDYVTTFSFSSLNWIHKNQKFHTALPLFGRNRSFAKSFFDVSPLKAFTKYASPQYFLNWIERIGSCHGECLALLEHTLQHPDENPKHFIKGISVARVCYYQTLEIVRGELEHIEQEILSQFPEPDERIYAEDSNITSIFEQRQFKGSVILRFYRDNRAHTIMYHSYPISQNFWFYNGKNHGFYRYPSEELLIKHFISHIENFFVTGKSKYNLDVFKK